MTDIKMLPLPKKAQLVNPYAGRGIPTYGHSDETLTDYARAVAEHNVASRDAEIEALRAMLGECYVLAGADTDGDPPERHYRDAVRAVGDLRRDYDEACEEMHGPEGHAARAERLAEALRGALDAVRGALQDAHQNAEQKCCGRSVGMHDCCGAPETIWAPEDRAVVDKLAPIERLLSTALRDHDQEGKDG